MTLRLVEAIHGHLAILALAGLLHPAWMLRKGGVLTPGRRLALSLAALAAVAAYASGIFLYEDYRRVVKPELFRLSSPAGMLFETKEHLAFVTIMLVLASTVAALAAPSHGVAARRLAARGFGAAFAAALIVAALGTYTAAVRGF